jgi:hypothetical protein
MMDIQSRALMLRPKPMLPNAANPERSTTRAAKRAITRDGLKAGDMSDDRGKMRISRWLN